ncbi:hypothetical protein ABZ951_27740 [Streptomyces sp. NPDC046215]|uniref:C2H2-type domain-containing protein n=1 Tax=Streptomyces stramineus TaxID=173861 RepID=A0ABP3JCS6_9ACTN
MSEIAGTSHGVRPTVHPAARPVPGTGAPEPAHESYAFACMRCGHGWEQSYEIQHPTDAEGRPSVVYYADGRRVPSPLTNPTCDNCGGHVVRIMRSGQVSHTAGYLHQPPQAAVRHTGHAQAGPLNATTAERIVPEPPEAPRPAHHWHLSDLLHPFQHRR